MMLSPAVALPAVVASPTAISSAVASPKVTPPTVFSPALATLAGDSLKLHLKYCTNTCSGAKHCGFKFRGFTVSALTCIGFA